MVDTKALDQALTALVEKKIALSELDYSDSAYDEIEEELHDLEDSFIEQYGSFLEEALYEVHDEYCPDSEVLLPIAYLANNYLRLKGENGGFQYEVSFDEGVLVDVDDYPGKSTRLVLVPGPTRIVLNIDRETRAEVWQAEEK